MHFDIGEVVLLLFIGVGPVKSFVPFLDATRGLSRSDQIRKASRVVLTVGVTSLLLLALGQLLEHLFHFSEPALIVAGGLILGVLGLQMVLKGTDSDVDHNHQLGIVVPIAVPLTLNPVGIAALIVLSGVTAEMSDATPVLLALLGILVLDMVALSFAALVKSPGRQIVTVIEIVFGVLVVALAIDVVGIGIGDFFAEQPQ
jgi:multiple antibiotic resistance protein